MMIGIANFSRWLISTVALLQGAFFLYITYYTYSLYGSLHAQWIARVLFLNAAAPLTGILSLATAYFFFVRRVWAKYLAAFVFMGVIVWFLTAIFSKEPRELDELVSLLPSMTALGFLLACWKTRQVERSENLD
jgi:hypothetical protein